MAPSGGEADADDYAYIVHYASKDTVRSIFVKTDKRFEDEWEIPYGRVEKAIMNAVDSHWNYLPVHERTRGGLFALTRRGPGEMEDVITGFAKTESMIREISIRREISMRQSERRARRMRGEDPMRDILPEAGAVKQCF